MQRKTGDLFQLDAYVSCLVFYVFNPPVGTDSVLSDTTGEGQWGPTICIFSIARGATGKSLRNTDIGALKTRTIIVAGC